MPSLLQIARTLPANKGKVAATQAALAKIFGRDEPVMLAFSGGKDGAVLTRLCEPYAGRFKLIWTNTGLNFPHVEAFIREAGARYGLIELKSNVAADWRENGLPAEALTVANALGDGCHTEPKLQAWVGCCARNLAGPIREFLCHHGGPITLLHGQRREDKAPGLGMSAMSVPDHVHVEAPLAEWTNVDIFDFVAAEEVPLPEHYGEGVIDSLDCRVCPAQLSLPHAPRMVAYMKDRYPAELQIMLTGARRAHAAVNASSRRLAGVIARARKDEKLFVAQRTSGVGDCMIAALATAAGISYEESAAALGFPCDPETGLPDLPQGRGVNINEATLPLLKMGLPFATTMTKESDPESPAMLPSSDELKAILPGRNAVLIIFENEEGHALAWKDGRVVDAAATDPFHRRLNDLTLMGAIIFTEGAG
ncbi:MAG: hypothetical protein BGN87_11545 [Rhizobiales bacterium 65-79]|jgi:3'-phosphoadenosine 5'-phosphosulfate sulfotransferase (PAPS reductase)/FAD synthetase|nr:phosphoadenosine phosphosulfate reductase family protein [Hyphomicrobiales bacterium]OJU07145.1 MAG: hypothetical protein BGN87_11545 [Rhizobiales bacterium 65-79]